MHDGTTLTIADAILRHAGEAERAAHDFRKLGARDQAAILEFLKSL
jgi:CxxC motif-containing protein (DUF1111 family)